MYRKPILSSVAVLAVALPLLSCSSPDPARALTVALSADPRCVDPHQAPYTEALHVGRQLVDTLTDQDPDTGEIVPSIAESWTVSPDATHYEFVLRQGVRFSDGTAVDASAVAANFAELVDLGAESPFGASYTENLTAATAVDDRTVAVEFSEPSAQFLQATSMVTTGLLSSATLDLTPDERCAGAIVGSGPFVLEQYTPNESVTLTARSDYAWPSAASDHSGAADISGIDFVVMPEAGVRSGALLSGQIDVDTDVRPESEAGLDGQGATVLSRPRPGMGYTFLPNVTSTLLTDPSVRTALSKGIDRPALDGVLSVHEKHSTNVLSSSTPMYEDRTSALSYDPEGAAATLDAAGWRIQPGESVRSKNGVALAPRLVYANTDTRADVYQVVQQQLTKIGVALQLTPMAAGGVEEATSSGQYEFVSWAITRPDPEALNTVFRLTSANPNRREVSSDVDSALNAALDTLSRSAAPEARRAATEDVVDELITQGLALPLFEQSAVIGVADSVSGITLDASSRPLFYEASMR